MKNYFVKLIICLLFLLPLRSSAQTKNARVIVLTDGEVDDQSSMIRFLLNTCDIDLLAIIETNSVYQRHGHSKEGWLQKELAAYEKVYPNLIKHNAFYPTADAIRAKCFVGDEDSTHLSKITSHQPHWLEQKPGTEVIYMPDEWDDTPGSDRIVELLLDKNPEPVYITAWGGGNTAAKAFYKLKKAFPADYERAISKVTMYNIWYQDNAGNYIETYHPKVTMLYSNAFNETWAYRIQTATTDFVTNGVKNNHGPLGALYPQTYISEGDSPSFLYTVNNGLRSYENPSYGGWGGRFVKSPQFQNVFIDTEDDNDIKKPLSRWIGQVNNDFEAKLNWCVASRFKDANHKPLIMLKGADNRTVKAGEHIKLNAAKSKDPDGTKITFKWWQYKEAGTYKGIAKIESDTNAEAIVVIPADAKVGTTIHLILEVADSGKPSLVSYKRIILTVKP